MDAKEYILRQVTIMRRLSDAALKDTTDEQFNWLPPGTVNPIRAIFVHLLTAEDNYIQVILQGKARLWETEGWGEKIGLPTPPGRGRGWDEMKSKPLTIAPVLAYEQAVRTATNAYLANLSDEELERQVDFIGGKRPVADVLATLVVHTVGHAGEIAALKGLQGVKGLPF